MKLLNKPIFLILALLLIILLSLKHNFAVYQDVAQSGNLDSYFGENSSLEIAYTLFMMLAFDFAIFMLAVRGNRNAAITFSIFTFILNAYFYVVQIPGIQMLYKIIPGLIFAGMTAYGIYYFSEEFALSFRQNTRLQEMEKFVQELQNKLQASYTQVSGLSKDLNRLSVVHELTSKKSDKRKRKIVGLSDENLTLRNQISELETAQDKLKLKLLRKEKSQRKAEEHFRMKFAKKDRKAIIDARIYREKLLQSEDLSMERRMKVEKELEVLNRILSKNV